MRRIVIVGHSRVAEHLRRGSTGTVDEGRGPAPAILLCLQPKWQQCATPQGELTHACMHTAPPGIRKRAACDSKHCRVAHPVISTQLLSTRPEDCTPCRSLAHRNAQACAHAVTLKPLTFGCSCLAGHQRVILRKRARAPDGAQVDAALAQRCLVPLRIRAQAARTARLSPRHSPSSSAAPHYACLRYLCTVSVCSANRGSSAFHTYQPRLSQNLPAKFADHKLAQPKLRLAAS